MRKHLKFPNNTAAECWGFVGAIFSILVGVVAFAGTLCDSTPVDPICKPLTAQESLAQDQCEIQKSAANCEEWEKANPDKALNFRRCNVVATCPTFTKATQYAEVCKDSVQDAWGELGARIYQFVTTSSVRSPDMKAREEYLEQCTSVECKTEMLGPYAKYFTAKEIAGCSDPAVEGCGVNGVDKLDLRDPANDTYLNGLSAKTLYRRVLERVKKQVQKNDMETPWVEPWTGQAPQLPRSLSQKIDDVLEKAGMNHTACYDPVILAEMRCYAFAAVVDPLLMAGAVAKIARIGGKTVDVIDSSVRFGVRTKKSASEFLAGFSPKAPLTERLPAFADVPNVTKKIELASQKIRAVGFAPKIKKGEQIPWERNASFLDDRAARANLRKNFKDLDPEIQKGMVDVYNKMADKNAFQDYMEKLSADAITEVRRRGLTHELNDLNSGVVPRNAVLRVLVQRSKTRGDGRISTIIEDGFESSLTRKPGTNAGFRQAVTQGPFFDKKFKGKSHGADSHFLQRDYIADVVANATKGNSQKFWDFMGSKKGVNYWVALFDAPKTSFSLTSPDVMRKLTKNYLPMK